MFDPQSTPIPYDDDFIKSRAKNYALLANAWRYPDKELIAALLNDNTLSLAPARSFTSQSEEGRRIQCEKSARAQERLRSTPLEELRASHARLFGHSVRGICPPYELEYGHSEIIQQTAELADLAGFYHAFGMSLTDSACERADHISVECEFLSVLCAKEWWGVQRGNRELAETCADARRLFLRDHFARWVPAFANRVKDADDEGFYGRVASMSSALIEEECRQLELEVGPQWIELRPADPARDAAIDCSTDGCADDAPDCLVQIGFDRSTGPVK